MGTLRHAPAIGRAVVWALLALLALLLSPRSAASQPREYRAVGFYLGLLGEQARFAGRNADAGAEGSGRLGVHVGRWALGVATKTIRAGALVIPPDAPVRSEELQVGGIEVARAFRPTGRIQPQLAVLVGYARVDVGTTPRLGQPWTRARASTQAVELAAGASVPLWKIARIDARAGVRVAPSVTMQARRYPLTGPFINGSLLMGWLGDWRKH